MDIEISTDKSYQPKIKDIVYFYSPIMIAQDITGTKYTEEEIEEYWYRYYYQGENYGRN